MNIAVVKNAIGWLDKLLSKAKEALWNVERDVFGDPGYGDAGGYEYPRDAMGAFIGELQSVLLVILEAADLPWTRASLVETWPKFLEGGGLKHTIENPEYQTCESPALTHLERIVEGLRLAVSESITSEEAWTLTRLEAILRDTAVLVRRRKIVPGSESDLRAIMHDYLEAFFPGFTRVPQISGAIKNFKPDCGIASVGAAIEFKIVHTEEQVTVAFSGVAEDPAGYRGSKDWTRFYAVFYQAEPFMSEDHLRYDLMRMGAAKTWTGIVVNGPIKSNTKKSKKDKESA